MTGFRPGGLSTADPKPRQTRGRIPQALFVPDYIKSDGNTLLIGMKRDGAVKHVRGEQYHQPGLWFDGENSWRPLAVQLVGRPTDFKSTRDLLIARVVLIKHLGRHPDVIAAAQVSILVGYGNFTLGVRV